MKIQVSSASRVLLVGKTGSGKSYLARALLSSVRRLIVLDPKGSPSLAGTDWGLEDWSADGVKRLRKGKDARLRVKYPIGGDWDPFLTAAYEIGHLTVYIDEAYGVTPPGKRPSDMLTALYTRGRELGLGTWAATQRPSWIPLFMVSEPEWFFMFRLQKQADRQKLEEMMGPEVLEPIPAKDKYGFWTYNDEWDKPIYTPKLNM